MLTATLTALLGCALLWWNLLAMAGRITTRRYAGVMAVAYTVAGAVCAAVGWDSNAYLIAAFTAVFVWVWWNNGGGDGTWRRLKSWAARFQGVRRTAPSHA